MNRERAESYLRVLAEAELRRAAGQSWGDAQRAGHAARIGKVAQVLAFVGALDAGVVDQILGDFELALGTRQAGQIGSVAGWSPRRAVPGRPGAGTAAGLARPPVPLGQVAEVRGADIRGEVFLLPYARVAGGPQFSVFARIRQPSDGWEPSGPRLFAPFTAIDDQEAGYQVSIRDIGSPVLGWTLMLRPDPPHDPRWLDLATGGGPAMRVILPGADPARPSAADVMISQTAPSPGEHLLDTIAARLLAAVPPRPHDLWLYGTAPRPAELPGIAGGLGEVIAALQEYGALPATSPVPGQLAALCARLNVTGHGITTPPASALPEPWLSVLTQYQHRQAGAAPARNGYAAAAVVLPELDEIQLMILGLHNCQDSTIMHAHASGPESHTIRDRK